MSLDSIINVSISRETAGVTQAGFGTCLIIGPNGPGGVNRYESLDAMAEDFETTDDEYKMAAKIFSQQPRVTAIKTFPAVFTSKVITVTPDVSVQEVQAYTITILGTPYTFTSDSDPSASEVVTGLLALINADTSKHGITASGTNTLILTGTAGDNFTATMTTENLEAEITTPGVLVDGAIADANDDDPDWYFLALTSANINVVESASAVIEAMRRIFIFRNGDAAVRTNATTDIVSRLKAKTLFRTGVFYTGTLADYGDAALIGKGAPYDPGSETWAYKTLAGVTVDAWTDTERGHLDTKNANYYITLAGVNSTLNGKVVGGEYIDVIRFIDWLQARMQEQIFGDIARNPKIPFTDSGIAVIEAGMRAVLQRGVDAGGIASSQDFTVTVPKASAISQNDKAARRLTGVKFTAVLAGAIHAVQIQGTVTL